MAELLTITLAANEQKQFRKAGRYIEIIDSTYAVTINLYSDLGGQTNTVGGALSGFFLEAVFGAVDIKNGPTAQTVQVLMLDVGEKGGSRRQPGNVRVIDQSADKTAAGSQFIGSAGSAASAGLGSLSGIRALTKTAYVKNVTVSSSIAGLIQLWFGNNRPTLNPVITANFGINKLSSGVGSLAEAVRGNSAGASPTTGELPGAVAIVGFSITANTPFTFPITTPIALPPGYALIVSSTGLMRDVVFAADFEEGP